MNLGVARELHVRAHNALVRHGISSFDGDYGELIVHEVIGGKLMPPTWKDYDIEHPHYGRVQVKTRTLLDLANGRSCTETRAVLKTNRNFDWLAHLILDKNLHVRNLILTPLHSIRNILDEGGGKISIRKSSVAEDAIDFSYDAVEAQRMIDGR